MGIKELICNNTIDAREKLYNIEERMNVLRYHISKTLDSVKTYEKAYKSYVKAEEDLINCISQFDSLISDHSEIINNEKGNVPVEQDSTLKNFCKLLKAVNLSNQNLVAKVPNIIQKPLEKLESELRESGELKKKMIKHREDYDQLFEKGKLTKASKSKISEWQTSSNDYIKRLIELKFKKEVEIIDTWTNWVVVSLVHHFGAQKTYKKFHSLILNRKQNLLQQRKDYETEKNDVNENLINLITNEYYDTSEKFCFQSYLYSGTVAKKKKWWIVSNNHLYKYNSYSDYCMVKDYDLVLFSIKKLSDSEIQLSSPSFEQGKLIFNTRSKEDTKRWISVVSASIERSFGTSNEPTTARGDTKNPLMILKNIEGNGVCADCGEAAPSWVSINLGILVCIECSGAHRNIGVQYSQVRSLTLDKLESHLVKSLTLVGNKLANSVFEQLIVSQNATRLTTNSERVERETFISNKYKKKRFLEVLESKNKLNPKLYALCSNVLQSGVLPTKPDMKDFLSYKACGADLNFTPQGESPLLCIASAKANETILPFIEFIYRNGADINIQNAEGNTPIHLAVQNDNKSFIEWLFEKNPDTNIKNKEGKTVLQLAESLQLNDIASEIRRHIERTPIKKKTNDVVEVEEDEDFEIYTPETFEIMSPTLGDSKGNFGNINESDFQMVETVQIISEIKEDVMLSPNSRYKRITKIENRKSLTQDEFTKLQGNSYVDLRSPFLSTPPQNFYEDPSNKVENKNSFPSQEYNEDVNDNPITTPQTIFVIENNVQNPPVKIVKIPIKKLPFKLVPKKSQEKFNDLPPIKKTMPRVPSKLNLNNFQDLGLKLAKNLPKKNY
eukprot:TRINITY_DN7473_c0_g1_i1.p1 TRINITY_DN7473_c0_g1~~TRINITY_DN7473_c0_g1_i1.p1  ORF type:complete len:841 (+),score=223.40 TRINITY_DN7473_c0_g1_i1:36-2558(+)